MILVAILDEIYTVGIAVLVYDLHYFINIMRPVLITIDKVIETPPFKTPFQRIFVNPLAMSISIFRCEKLIMRMGCNIPYSQNGG